MADDFDRFLHWLEKAWRELLELLKLEAATRITLSTKEGIMSDYQLNAGDSVVVTITDTDDVTGAVVTPDAGSVTAVLSSSTDTVVVDPSGAFATITAGDVASVGNTVTVNAAVGGVASTSAVGTYDVVAVTPPPPDATSLSLSFGTETAPPTTGPSVGTAAGEINPVTGQVNT